MRKLNLMIFRLALMALLLGGSLNATATVYNWSRYDL